MGKAEKFIEDYTRNCSQLHYNSACTLRHCITPDQARRAVEIAREEIYEWLTSHYRDYMHNPTGEKLEAFFGMDMITDLKQSMKDE